MQSGAAGAGAAGAGSNAAGASSDAYSAHGLGLSVNKRSSFGGVVPAATAAGGAGAAASIGLAPVGHSQSGSVSLGVEMQKKRTAAKVSKFIKDGVCCAPPAVRSLASCAGLPPGGSYGGLGQISQLSTLAQNQPPGSQASSSAVSPTQSQSHDALGSLAMARHAGISQSHPGQLGVGVAGSLSHPEGMPSSSPALSETAGRRGDRGDGDRSDHSGSTSAAVSPPATEVSALNLHHQPPSNAASPHARTPSMAASPSGVLGSSAVSPPL